MWLSRILIATLDGRFHHALEKVALVLKARLSVPAVAAVVGVAMIVWILFGTNVRGAFLLLWLTVPLLIAAACVCIGGPDRLFDKERYEGRVVFQITRTDAVTMLDVVGTGFAAAGALLAITLVG